MLTLKGRYNSAIVMADEIEETTREQIEGFLNHPAFAGTHIAIMADCHAGAGAVIGFTAKMNNYVIPNVVGVDIGCGIAAYNLGHLGPIDFQAFDDFVRANIPSGFSKRANVFPLEAELLDCVIEVAAHAGQDMNTVALSIGTLGGGNHFIELDRDTEGVAWLVVHTGSRNFGLKTANHHQNIAKDLMKTMLHNPAVYKQLEFLPMDYGGRDYLEDMKVVQKYADANREAICDILLRNFFGREPASLEKIVSVHNYISFQDDIIRKGAISAHANEPVVIPLNMRDGIILAVGKDSAKWNYSAPHGAGRVMARKEAKRTLGVEEFRQTMAEAGVWSSCISESTLDEAPMVYKDAGLIEAAIGETVDVVSHLKPVYNFKAT